MRDAALADSEAFRGGLAGAVVFSFTDDWWRDGRRVDDWQMGLTTRDRQPKPSFAAVREMFAAAPHFPLPRAPKISVVVASLQRRAHARPCLDSLKSLNYPDYEVILVDDGSTDTTPQIAARYPEVRYLRHQKNLGLSVARNTGIAAATGEIIAFTDADCRADEDWLYYLVGDLLESEFAAMGGPNLLPPEDSAVAAAVMASPGGPAHVMLTDRQAEHMPGCNMAFYNWALRRSADLIPFFAAPATTWICAGGCSRPATRSASAPRPLSGIIAAPRWGPICASRKAMARRKRCWCASIPNISMPWAAASGGGAFTPAPIPACCWAAGHLPRPLRQRRFPIRLPSEPPLGLMLCTTLEYHVLVDRAAVGAFGHVPPAAAPGAGEPADFPRRVRAARPAGGAAPEQNPLVVAPAGGAAVFPAADRARLGALPGAPGHRTGLSAHQNLDSVALRDSGQSAGGRAVLGRAAD